MQPKYYYHLTTKDKLPEILKNGLKPQIGENAAIAGEEKPAIYLCRLKDLPYWKIILDRIIVLKVKDITVTMDDIYDYSMYSEYVYDKTIPVKSIARIYTPKPTLGQMQKLCIDYIYNLSKTTIAIARFYNNHVNNSEIRQIINKRLDCTLNVLANLDYATLDTENIRNELKEMGKSGDYTFLDTYMNTDKKLYQMLIEYPEDDLTEKRQALYNYIIKTFDKCLDVYTGGFTG